MTPGYVPLYERTRGVTVESVHYGAVAVVDAQGGLRAYAGEPRTVTFLRSSAKPFQALPLIEAGGQQALGLDAAEIALMCASHDGTDDHVAVVRSIQAKGRFSESDLLCGVHPPFHKPTAEALQARGEAPTPNRHNCSGKHSGMLALARLQGWSLADYVNPNHPVQQEILLAFADLCGLTPGQVAQGVDGCSALNFAVPLFRAALAFARLGDPVDLSPARAAACRTVTSAMQAHPEMVAGTERFDTRLMQVMARRLVAKGGAEGYQGVTVFPGALGPDAPGLGISVKISDGDQIAGARAGVTLEVLRQLGLLAADDLAALAEFGPERPVRNQRDLIVGTARPSFQLQGPDL